MSATSKAVSAAPARLAPEVLAKMRQEFKLLTGVLEKVFVEGTFSQGDYMHCLNVGTSPHASETGLTFLAKSNVTYYDVMAEFFVDQLQRHYTSFASASSPQSLLQEYAASWKRFSRLVLPIDHMLSFLSSQFKDTIAASKKRSPFSTVAECHVNRCLSVDQCLLHLWVVVVLAPHADRFKLAIVDWVTRDRSVGLDADEITVLTQVAKSLAELSLDEQAVQANQAVRQAGQGVKEIFVEYFETPVYHATRMYYEEESKRFLATNSITDYIQYAEARLTEESQRQYALCGLTVKLGDIVVEALVRQRVGDIEAAVTKMLATTANDEHVRRAYKLLRKTNNLNSMCDAFRSYVATRVTEARFVELATSVAESADGGAGPEAGAAGAAAGASTAGADDEAAGGDDDAGDGGGGGGGGGKKGKGAASKASKVKAPHERLVDEMLALMSALRDRVADVLGADEQFYRIVESELASSVNSKSYPFHEYLSLSLDVLLKDGKSLAVEVDRTRKIDLCISLFKLINEKDLFELYYKRHLSKRLLQGRSASSDAEREVINKLKRECGTSFTHKLEGMFKDTQLSEDLMTSFQSSPFAKRLPFELSVRVLTTGIWMMTGVPCKLPAVAEQAQRTFGEFYTLQHSGKSLQWENTMGNAELRAVFPSKVHEISVSTTQMAVLSLFNDVDQLSLSQIVAALAVTTDDASMIERDLLALSCAKYKVLTKEPKSKKMSPTDVFTFAADFSCKLFKFKIGTVALPENAAQRDKTNEKADEDRAFKIDAAVVRIMKARKTLDHANLIAEVTKQLASRFTANPQMIKKQIEKLIEREYLERDAKDRKMYKYLA